MAKVMQTFAQKAGVEVRMLRFLTPEGVRIAPDDTPESVSICCATILKVNADLLQLDLEEDDKIDVHGEQIGGE